MLRLKYSLRGHVCPLRDQLIAAHRSLAVSQESGN
jgi:hypothetical protein